MGGPPIVAAKDDDGRQRYDPKPMARPRNHTPRWIGIKRIVACPLKPGDVQRLFEPNDFGGLALLCFVSRKSVNDGFDLVENLAGIFRRAEMLVASILNRLAGHTEVTYAPL